MSFLRRAAIVTFAAAALVTGTGSVASAAPAAPSAVSFDGPDGHGDGNGGGHGRGGRPIRFGPFEFPANGNISGGFAWDTSNGGGIGF